VVEKEKEVIKGVKVETVEVEVFSILQ